jgi:glucose/mannose transport system substrate-binding protein
MKRIVSRRDLARGCLPLYLAGCGDSESSTPDEESTDRNVELFSWWVAPSEAEALQALIDLHHENHPHDIVVNAAIDSGTAAKGVLAERIQAGSPPDLYQENAYALPIVMRDNPGSLATVTSLFEEEGLDDVVPAEVTRKLRLDGEVYAIPVNIHRENALHYNKQLFKSQGIEVPTTLKEFLAACEAFKAAGITPIATSHQGWILRILLNGILPASLGYDAFAAYFADMGELDEAAMRQAIATFDQVLTSYVNDSASDPNFGWTDAADLLLNDQAAMLIHGDWTKGYLTSLGWEPGVGFGVTSAPDASDIFLYGADTFALLAGGKQPEAAKAFLRTVASKEGQVAFNKIKGSSPMRLDVPAAEFDVVAQATLQSLKDAKLRLLAPANMLWDDALNVFAADHDVDALIAVYRDNRAAGL